MPDLPTVTVTAAQATRIQTAFGGVEPYRAWLRQAIRDYVLSSEVSVLREGVQAQIDAKVATIEAELSNI